jgi:hypothetical protein
MKRKAAKTRWDNLHEFAKITSGDKLARKMISLVKKAFKQKPKLLPGWFAPQWSVDGTVSLTLNGIDVTSLSGPLSYRELEALARILRLIDDDWTFFIVEIAVVLKPWLREKAKLLDSYAKIAKEVEGSYKKAGEHLKCAQDKLPK